MVDASYSTFIRDVYDARTPLECELAMRQISIFWGSGDKDNDLKFVNPYINGFCNEHLAKNITSRRNALVFCKTENEKNTFDTKLSTVNASDTHKYVNTTFIVFNENTFAGDLMSAMSGMPVQNKTSVYTLRNTTSEPMNVSDWRFHGIALGMAKLDQRDGDNVCTLLRSGAQTIRNGPFKIMAGDPVGWVFPHELCCFDREGKRKPRWTATVLKFKRLFKAGPLNAGINPKVGIITAENTDVGPNGEFKGSLCATAKIDHTGDGSKNTQLKLQVVPLRVSPGCCRVTDSIRDACERRVGTAISNAAGSAMVDLLVGSDL